MTISAADVRELLAAGPDAVLVLLGGHPSILSPAELQAPQYRGALQIAARADLLDRVGTTELSERVVVELAADLDTAVSEMGG